MGSKTSRGSETPLSGSIVITPASSVTNIPYGSIDSTNVQDAINELEDKAAAGGQTGAEIKALYEAEADTNEFSDAEQTNLANQSGTNTGDEAAASLTVAGVLEIATPTEIDTGTDDGRGISPLGLASSALQTKVDGIEASATADQTAAEILTALLTVDGTGTGLDADLLDGVEAAGFSLVAHTHVNRVAHTWAISGEIKVPVGDTDFILPMFISLASGQTASLVKCRYSINSGTSVTAKLQKGGVDITGFTSLSVTTTPTTTDPADVALAEDDEMALVITAVSGTPTNMNFTIFVEYTQ